MTADNKQKTSAIVRDIYLKAKSQAKNRNEHFTCKTFSEITGVKQNTAFCWINGKRNPPDYVVDMLKERLTEAGYDV